MMHLKPHKASRRGWCYVSSPIFFPSPTDGKFAFLQVILAWQEHCCFLIVVFNVLVQTVLLLASQPGLFCAQIEPYWFGSRHGFTGVVQILEDNAQKRTEHPGEDKKKKKKPQEKQNHVCCFTGRTKCTWLLFLHRHHTRDFDPRLRLPQRDNF